MNVSKTFLPICSLLILLFSCKNQQMENHCPNELTLITPSDSLPLVQIDCTSHYSDTTECINLWKHLSSNNDDSRYDFRFKIHGSNIYEAFTHSPHIPFCGWYNCISVFVNFDDQILIENEFLDSNLSISANVFEHYKSPEGEFPKVEFRWDAESSIDSVGMVLDEITKGYLDFIDYYSKNTFDKSLCNLDSIQLQELKKEIPLKFDFTPPPPKPPPPTIEGILELNTNSQEIFGISE